MKIIITAQLNAIKEEEAPEEVPQNEPVPDPSIILKDFEEGRNVTPLLSSSEASNEQIKVAGIHTNHFKHVTFNKCFAKLPNDIKEIARNRFRQMAANPSAVPLRKMHRPVNTVSVVICEGKPAYRALAVKAGPYYVWYWCGTHENYNTVVDQPTPAVTLPSAARKALQDGTFQQA